jgi:hypothetical protein
MFKAGFAEIDITPPPGTKKGGWMEDLSAEIFLDPLFARVAVFENGNEKIAFVQLDLLSIRWSDTADLRRRIEREYDFPGENIMVSATHNHAGPAIARLTPVEKQVSYLEDMKSNCLVAFGKAVENMQDAEIGFSTVKEPDVAHNRRTVMRDGLVKSQTSYANPEVLCLEGPIDPELAVLVARSTDGKILGALINYACHPVHHGGTNEISAGFPGVVAAKMKDHGYPVALYLNGAYGNVITSDFEHCRNPDKEDVGQKLFEDVEKAFGNMTFSVVNELSTVSETLELPFRNITEEEYYGRIRGAQRFRSDELYEESIDRIIEKIKRYGTQPVEIQVFKLGDLYFVGIPAEYFVEFQLRIKTETFPKRSLVVGGANGMIGYVPTKAAFERGGYETTLGPPSRMAPETGDCIADIAIKLIKQL